MRPNFLIIGAPKCGTSSLYNWMAAHPDVAGTLRKEPFFLMDRGHPLTGRPNLHDDGPDAYAALFPDSAATARIRMEATTHYLYQDTAREVLRDWPEVKVAVVMRAPAERVYSSFSYTRENLARLDPSLSFAAYLDLLERGESLHPRWCRDAGSAYVLDRDPGYSHYARHLAPWIEALGRDRVRPIVFEHMRADPEATLAGLTAWLGLDAAPPAPGAREQKNRTEAVRSRGFHRAARAVNAKLRLPPVLKRGLSGLYGRFQYASRAERPAEDAAAVAALARRYDEDTRRLSALTGLDLSCWAQDQSDRDVPDRTVTG